MEAALTEDRYLSRLRAAVPRPYHLWFKIVDEVDPIKPEYPSIRFIQGIVCDHYGVSLGEMKSDRRHGPVIIPRHVAMFLAKEITPRSFPVIAAAFNRSDHSSPLFAFYKIQRLMLADADIAADVATLKLTIAKRWGN